MLQELDDAVVEFGLEAITLVEEMEIEKDVDTSHVHTRSGQTKTVATSTQYTAEFVSPEPLDVYSMFEDNGAPKTIDVTVTGIQKPHVLTLKDSIITSHSADPDQARIELIAQSAESEKLW